MIITAHMFPYTLRDIRSDRPNYQRTFDVRLTCLNFILPVSTINVEIQQTWLRHSCESHPDGGGVDYVCSGNNRLGDLPGFFNSQGHGEG